MPLGIVVGLDKANTVRWGLCEVFVSPSDICFHGQSQNAEGIQMLLVSFCTAGQVVSECETCSDTEMSVNANGRLKVYLLCDCHLNFSK